MGEISCRRGAENCQIKEDNYGKKNSNKTRQQKKSTVR